MSSAVRLEPFDPVVDAWGELCRRTDASPFLRPEWHQHWRDTFAPGAVTVATLRSGGELRAALPLLRRGRRLATVHNGHTPATGPVATDDRALAELVRGLCDRAPNGLVLDGLTLDPAKEALWHDALSVPHRRLEVTGVHRRTDASRDWDGFVAGRKASIRKMIRRAHRRAERFGAVEFATFTHVDTSLLQKCFLVEASGWKGREGTAIAQLPAVRHFYENVVDWAASEGWLHLSTLRIDGRLAAFELALRHGGVLYLLKTGFDEDLAAAGPGMLLVYEVLRRAFDDDEILAVDWGGDDAVKRDLSDTATPVHRVTAHPLGAMSYARHLWIDVEDAAAQWLRRSLPPGARATLRGIRARRSAVGAPAASRT